MDPLLSSISATLWLVLKMGSIMLISLVGVELLMQKGLMQYLRPLGKPMTKLANLPSESTLSFLTAIGSMIAAHTMTAQFYEDKKLTRKQLIATGVLNTVPFHFKETLTFQFPVVLPLLGVKLCLIYITAFWLTGFIKLGFVIIYGQLTIPKPQERKDAFEEFECSEDDSECSQKTLLALIKTIWEMRKKMFFRMMAVLASVTLIIQFLMNSGLLKAFERLILPLTSLFNLPTVVVGPISAYIFSPTVGITYMSNLLDENLVSHFQAIVALLAGGVLMIPVTRLRRTLPRYMSIYGARHGAVICGLTTVLSMSSRIVVLVLVIILF